MLLLSDRQRRCRSWLRHHGNAVARSRRECSWCRSSDRRGCSWFDTCGAGIYVQGAWIGYPQSLHVPLQAAAAGAAAANTIGEFFNGTVFGISHGWAVSRSNRMTRVHPTCQDGGGASCGRWCCRCRRHCCCGRDTGRAVASSEPRRLSHCLLCLAP